MDLRHKEEVLCLALNGYHEARGQPAKAELMVNQVVLNRLEDERFPRTVCAVVKQQAGPSKCQFSWVCDRNSDEPRDPEAFTRSIDLASALLNLRDTLPDLTAGALYFHRKDKRPRWSRTMRPTAVGGDHVFYAAD